MDNLMIYESGTLIFSGKDVYTVIRQPKGDFSSPQITEIFKKPEISEIPESDYEKRIERDIDEEYETLT